MPDRIDIWSQVRHVLENGTPSDILALGCPKCGEPLRIGFNPESPQASGGTAGCLMISCRDYCSGLAIDGLQSSPSWISSLGMKFETEPSTS